jgi:hypothetical protein
MYDMRTIYFTNIIDSYYNHGYNSLNIYDKYHIVLMIISILTIDYRINLGEFVKTINLPIKVLRQFPILGLTECSKYVIPSLYDMSMSIIKRERICSDNNSFNKKIIKSDELLNVGDKYNYINEYIMKIYNVYERFIIEHLIDQYTSKNFTINTFYNLNTNIDEEEEEEEMQEVQYYESESEYENDNENDY